MKKPQRYWSTALHNVGIAWPTVNDEVGAMTTEPMLAEGATDYYESEEMDEWLKTEVLPVLREWVADSDKSAQEAVTLAVKTCALIATFDDSKGGEK